MTAVFRHLGRALAGTILICTTPYSMPSTLHGDCHGAAPLAMTNRPSSRAQRSDLLSGGDCHGAAPLAMTTSFAPRNDKQARRVEYKDVMREFSVVTGAFSYTGRYIAERLLALRQPVRTLTRHRPSGSDGGIEVAPLNFADRDGPVHTLRGAATLYHTVWVQVPRGPVTF